MNHILINCEGVNKYGNCSIEFNSMSFLIQLVDDLKF